MTRRFLLGVALACVAEILGAASADAARTIFAPGRESDKQKIGNVFFWPFAQVHDGNAAYVEGDIINKTSAPVSAATFEAHLLELQGTTLNSILDVPFTLKDFRPDQPLHFQLKLPTGFDSSRVSAMTISLIRAQ